jgi:hypothetical protein
LQARRQGREAVDAGEQRGDVAQEPHRQVKLEEASGEAARALRCFNDGTGSAAVETCVGNRKG